MFRFWRRFKTFPGVTVNAHKSGLSLSVGPRGAQLTVGQGGVRATAGLPGTGLFLTKKIVRKTGKPTEQTVYRNDKEYKIFMDFFVAIEHLEDGELDSVIEILESRQFRKIADIHNLLAWLYINNGRYDKAIDHFAKVAGRCGDLGKFFDLVELEINFTIPMRIGSHLDVDLWNAVDHEQLVISLSYACLLAGEDQDDTRNRLQKFYEENGGLKVLIFSLDIAIANEKHKDDYHTETILQSMAGIEDDPFIMLYRSIVAIEMDKKQAAIDYLSTLIKKRSSPLELRLKARNLRAGIYDEWDMATEANRDREYIETMGGKVDGQKATCD